MSAGQRWSKELPKEPGFYWWRRSVGFHKVLKLYSFGGGLCINANDDNFPIEEIDGGEWQGPITPHDQEAG